MDTSPFSPNDKVVCYVRDSGGDEQRLRNVSTTEQVESIQRFCQINELNLVHMYEQPHIDGNSIKDRRTYIQMMDSFLKPHFPDIDYSTSESKQKCVKILRVMTRQ